MVEERQGLLHITANKGSERRAATERGTKSSLRERRMKERERDSKARRGESTNRWSKQWGLIHRVESEGGGLISLISLGRGNRFEVTCLSMQGRQVHLGP